MFMLIAPIIKYFIKKCKYCNNFGKPTILNETRIIVSGKRLLQTLTGKEVD